MGSFPDLQDPPGILCLVLALPMISKNTSAPSFGR